MRFAFLPLLACCGWASAACPPATYDSAALAALRDSGFRIEDDAERNSLALDLLDCLDAADPVLRDGMAYEGVSTWLRSDQISLQTRRSMLDALLRSLTSPKQDLNGFRRPFAALHLSEMARTDRISAWLSDDQREALLAAGTAYLKSVRDYRGFDDREGWRHGVAHSADLLLQLVLNPALREEQVQRILDAVASQIAPAGDHFYVFGEPERLARPVLYAAMREKQSQENMHRWLEQIAQPAPLADWQAAFSSQAGLARRHNVRAFLSALYVAARDAENPALAALAPKALELIKSIP